MVWNFVTHPQNAVDCGAQYSLKIVQIHRLPSARVIQRKTWNEPSQQARSNDFKRGFDSTGVQILTVNGKLMEVYKCFRGNHMWTVIQRRLDGSVSFNRNWSSYKYGFGSLNSEFWLGNENIHLLTKKGLTYLRVDLMENNGEWKYAEYSNFSVDTEGNKYKLTVFGYSGDAGDNLAYHHGMGFSAPDVDNDGADNFDCAAYLRSAWWYNDCTMSDLNGEYGYRVHWSTLTRGIFSLKETRMMIRKP
ncbi:ficolin-1-like [Saccostrea echinata]|uniref:ficolin-1-like n=1 Tax=Saccostrea echinata TaxID=191078 RepID=UPI002A7F6425|nr:ficolin-1-like [Saccostrea echinata]